MSYPGGGPPSQIPYGYNNNQNRQLNSFVPPVNDNFQANSQNTQNYYTPTYEPQNQLHTNTDVHNSNPQLQKSMKKQFQDLQEELKKEINDEYPTKPWHDYFEEIKTTNKSEIVVETKTFYPVFVWESKKNLKIKISKPTQHFLETDEKGQGIKIKIITKKNIENEDQLWCKFTIKSDHLLWIRLRSNITGTNTNTNNSLKRKRGNVSTSTPKRRAGKNSNKYFLFRINIINPEIKDSIQLKNGKGICSFRDGSVEKIGVIDENRIDVYDQELKFEKSICKSLTGYPFGLSFHDDQFFVTNTNYYSIFNLNPEDDQTTRDFGQLKSGTQIPFQKIIHRKKKFHYILLGDSFVCNIRTLEDPCFIVLFTKPLLSSRLSDFVMIDEHSALILDSGSTTKKILQYDICSNIENEINLNEELKKRGFAAFDAYDYKKFEDVGKLSPVAIHNSKIYDEIENSQGICVWENYILISAPNGITFVDKTNFIPEKKIPLSYMPGKLTTIENNIFTIASPSFLEENENSRRGTKDISVDTPQREFYEEDPVTFELRNILQYDEKFDFSDTDTDFSEIGLSLFKKLFSSDVLTSPFLQHLKEELNKIDKTVDLLNDFMVQFTLKEIFHISNMNYNWNRMCFWFKILNLKYIHDCKTNAHISMNLQTTNKNKNFEKLGLFS